MRGRDNQFGKTYEQASELLSEDVTEEKLRNQKKRLDSLKTAGGEIGIWKDSEFTLSSLAEKVAKSQITPRRYFSVIFLNLFSFFENNEGELQYKHFLWEILNYFEKYGVNQIYSRDILVEIFGFINESNKTKRNNQRNQLFQYVTAAEYFEEVDGKSFKLTNYWKDKTDLLKSYCNLEYKDVSFEIVQERLNRVKAESKERYSEYLAKNESLLFKHDADQEYTEAMQKESKKDDEPIKSELKSRGINRIYFGAPGTGKSYNMKMFIRENGIDDYTDEIDHPNVYRTTLHPEFSYVDFVGQVMPSVKNDGSNSSEIIYEFVPNIFTQALKAAVLKPNEPIFLILEEMSRANVAAVFGDLFQLLDRDSSGKSEYQINNALIAEYIYKNKDKKIYIPKNLFILGTVNTSDQNVFVMDTAFKRRFEHAYVSTKINSEDEKLNDFSFNLRKNNGDILKLKWVDLVRSLNRFIVAPTDKNGLELSEDKQIGHFFIKFNNDEKDQVRNQVANYNQITGKLIHYLWDDVNKASFSENSLFYEGIDSFSELYELAINKKNFFSEDFLKLYDELTYKEV